MTHCGNCGAKTSEKFCSHCGQPVKIKRIDNHYISHEIFHLLHFEKGFFYTAKMLITKPGEAIREFITLNRSKHMKPVAFLVLCSVLFTIVSHLFHADNLAPESGKILYSHSSLGSVMNWVTTHYGYSNLICGLFYSLCVQLFFRKYKYNFFEITVLLCFVMGQGMLLLTIETFFFPLLGLNSYILIMFFISLGYPTWAIGQFFDKTKVMSYIKSLLAYALGYVLFYVVLIVMCLLIDIFLK
jgi:hypothetical protein